MSNLTIDQAYILLQNDLVLLSANCAEQTEIYRQIVANVVATLNADEVLPPDYTISNGVDLVAAVIASAMTIGIDHVTATSPQLALLFHRSAVVLIAWDLLQKEEFEAYERIKATTQADLDELFDGVESITTIAAIIYAGFLTYILEERNEAEAVDFVRMMRGEQ